MVWNDNNGAAAVVKQTYFDGAKSIQLDVLQQWSDLGNVPWANAQTPAHIASTVAFLYRCIDIRSNAVASMPWGLFQGKTEIASDDLDEMPAGYEFLEHLMPMLQRTEQALSTGSRAYLLKQANRVRVRGLQWLDPSTMEPVWTPQGITYFKRTLADGTTIQLSPADVIYIWYRGTSETEPTAPPAKAAMNAANVLSSVDLFAKGFFERGAIKGTLLSVEGNPPPAEKEKLNAWWTRMFGGGTKTAWEAGVVSASVTPVVIGEGISELSSANLTVEKREDIATAMGVPHSMVLSNAANFAVSESDRLNFYDTTIVPECKLIQRQLNEQLFAPLGLRFEFKPEQLPAYQADEGERATSFATYVNAGIKPSIAAQIVGLDLPEGVGFDDLDPNPEEVRLMAEAAAGGAQEDDKDDDEERKKEEGRFKSWAKKRAHPDVTKFTSAILSDDEKAALLSDKSIRFHLATWDAYP
jgi:HK97 family phage portal protein